MDWFLYDIGLRHERVKGFMSIVLQKTLFRQLNKELREKVNYVSNQRLSETYFFKNIQQDISYLPPRLLELN